MSKLRVFILLKVIAVSMFFIASIAYAAEEGKKYTIGAEDILNIRVLDRDELQRKVEVSQNGFISFPMIGEIKAGGLSVFALEQAVAKKLEKDGFLVDAQVSIEVAQYGSMSVFLLGEVVRDGRYFIKGKTHILSILAEAGGLSDNAGNEVVIIRENSGSSSAGAKESGVITINLDELGVAKNIDASFVYPGDTIQVPVAAKYYVSGEVNEAGEYKWEKQLSVRRAIAAAGGKTRLGNLDKVFIQRMKDGQEVAVRPEMTDFVQQKDIIVIPESFF